MEAMKYVAVVFILLGCHLANGQSEGCTSVLSPIGTIDFMQEMTLTESNFCWTIVVPAGKFIRLRVNNITTRKLCPESFLKITSEENGETHLICKSTNFKPPIITALSNVTVRFSVKEEYYYDEYDEESGFHLEFIMRDMECVNKDSFKCSATCCIPQAEVCDGIQDCENGLDEIGCVTGVLSLPGVEEARQKAVSWLKKERLSTWGWGDYTPRGVVALYLASDANFNGTALEEELMAKEIEIKVAVPLLRSSLTNSELSMLVNALLVMCHNPRDFYGNNLVKRLKEQVQKSPNVSHPISYLTLCNAREPWPPKAESDLKTILNSSLEYPFVKDLQAMAILALSCKANSTKNSLTSSISTLYKQTVEKLKTFQIQDGSFGNFHTTALVTQALISSGYENSKEWKLNATIQFLMKELDSPSVDFLSVYLALPILNGKTLADLYKVNCSANPRKHGDDPVSEVNEFLGPKMRVQYTLYIGDETDVVHTLSLKVPENYTAFQVMQLAEIEDHKYKFDYKVMSGKMYVYKIANISNDPEIGKFWLLYVRPSKETETLTHFALGPDEVVLKDGEELIFWSKTANI